MRKRWPMTGLDRLSNVDPLPGELFRGVLAWARHAKQDTGYADYHLQEDGEDTPFTVRWCGHPTAIYPYTVEVWHERDGHVATYADPRTGRGFRSVADAKAFALHLYWKEKNDG